MLEENVVAPPNALVASTLARELRKAGMSQAQVMEKAESGTFRRFEANGILELLQAGYKHFLYLSAPSENDTHSVNMV